MRVYISGPMRGVPRFNFPAFDHAESLLARMGHEPWSPARRDRENGFDPVDLSGWEPLSSLGFDLRDALAADCEYICRHAEAVLVLDGWTDSRGARAEVALALALGLPVLRFFYAGRELPELVAERRDHLAGLAVPA